jgi:hypothetical protein
MLAMVSPSHLQSTVSCGVRGIKRWVFGVLDGVSGFADGVQERFVEGWCEPGAGG